MSVSADLGSGELEFWLLLDYAQVAAGEQRGEEIAADESNESDQSSKGCCGSVGFSSIGVPPGLAQSFRSSAGVRRSGTGCSIMRV